jgi:hypothetical protein
MLVNPETGFADGTEPAETAPLQQSASVSVSAEGPPSIAELVQQALSGRMALARPLRDTDSKTLSPLHINMVFDRLHGLKPGEIARKYDVTPVTVSRTLHHPFAEVIIGTALGRLADGISDPVERIQAYAHECISVKVDVMRDTTTSKMLRDSIASDLLDRGGFSATRKVDVKHSEVPQPTVSAEFMARIAEGLDEARRIKTVDYSRFVTTPATSTAGAGEGDAVASKGGSGEAAPRDASTSPSDPLSAAPTTLQLPGMQPRRRLAKPTEPVPDVVQPIDADIRYAQQEEAARERERNEEAAA